MGALVVLVIVVFLLGVVMVFQGMSMWSNSKGVTQHSLALVVLLCGFVPLWLAGWATQTFFTYLK